MPVPTSHATSVRLGKLRNDLLSAEYRLCVEKATLMTEYFQKRKPSGPIESMISRFHARVYAGALGKQTTGHVPHRLAQKANSILCGLYDPIGDSGDDQSNVAALQLEFARAFAYVLERSTLRVYDHELIVGNPSSQRIGAPLHPDYGGLLIIPELETLSTRKCNPIGVGVAQKRELRERILPFWFPRSVLAQVTRYSDDPRLAAELIQGEAFVLTQIAGISHLTPNYPRVLRLGFCGILERIAQAQNELAAQMHRGGTGTRTQKNRAAFLEAARLCAEAAIAFGRRFSRHVEGLSTRETDPVRRGELTELAGILSRVPETPAQTFHEALQSVMLTHVMVHKESFQHGVSFGRMDQYLYPYFLADIEAGRLDRARAVELLGCFLGKAAELVPLFFDRATEYFSGLSSASGITLGGMKSGGGDAANELSELFLEAHSQLRLRQPNLHVRVHDASSPTFMARAYETIKKGGGMPALFNDRAIVRALEDQGMPAADAEDYSIVGCAEWGVPYKSYPAAGAAFVNLAHVLLLALNGGERGGHRVGAKTPAAGELRDMQAVQSAFSEQLYHLLRRVVAGNNAVEVAHAEHRPLPFLSTLVEGCIESMKEVNAGGATHNTSGIQGVGFADVVDSLVAIDHLVFASDQITLAQLSDALERNFAGHEVLLDQIRARLPKFGEDNEETNRWAKWVSELFVRAVSSFVSPRGGRYLAGFWSMTTHQGFGRRTGALPCGRKAGEPLANGMSPRRGCEMLGPTAAMSSAACVTGIGNGAVLNQKLDSKFVANEDGTAIMDALVRGYFAKGGMQVQFNVLDPSVLVAARERPADYRDLVVRISGYSAYFNDLTESMKDELVDRTLHGTSA